MALPMIAMNPAPDTTPPPNEPDAVADAARRHWLWVALTLLGVIPHWLATADSPKSTPR